MKLSVDLRLCVCIMISVIIYSLAADLPEIVKDDGRKYMQIEDPENISDEQLLYIALHGMSIENYQPGHEYIKPFSEDRKRAVILYEDKKDNTVIQYYYYYQDHYGYGAQSGTMDVMLCCSHYIIAESGEAHLADESSGRIVKSVVIPEDWSLKKKNKFCNDHRIMIYIGRILIVMIVSMTVFNKNRDICNLLNGKSQLVSASVLLLTVVELVFRAAIYTRYYEEMHFSVWGGVGSDFRLGIPLQFIRIYISDNLMVTILFAGMIVLLVMCMMMNKRDKEHLLEY